MAKTGIGLWGLAFMGQNLVLNMENKGFSVAVYNRTTQKVKNFIQGPARLFRSTHL
jgi:6-phosphogluconate dehydrogenase